MVLKKENPGNKLKSTQPPQRYISSGGPKCVKGSEQFYGQGWSILSAAEVFLILAIESLSKSRQYPVLPMSLPPYHVLTECASPGQMLQACILGTSQLFKHTDKHRHVNTHGPQHVDI